VRRIGRAATRATAALALAGALSGCVAQGLAFRIDDRLTFTSPEDRSTVTLPVVVDWDIRDFRIAAPGSPPRADAGYFAVFVDRAPMPPGEHLRWIFRNDEDCRSIDGCPDEEYLRSNAIYTTTDTRIVLEQIPRPPSRDDEDEDEEPERHSVTVVLLDGSGKRIGESAFQVEFDLEREPQL
jgi:hypothetical protein